ncbi:MAG: type VI secretion system protein TssA [Gammaproteobacteria bacterium]|nr:type VI secretion system protein TssA [Gammaproteobacteria bacterium]
MSISENEILELGTKPISGKNPAGGNVRYDDEFELIEDELSKQGSMIDRGQVNWKKVNKACSNLLQNKSKDLKVSCYFIRSLIELENIAGLSLGLEVNFNLLNLYWANLYPTKIRAKANAYEWLSSKLIPLLESYELTIDDLDDLKKSYDLLKNIEHFLNEKLESEAPALGKLRRLMNERIEPLSLQKELEEKEEEHKASEKSLEGETDSLATPGVDLSQTKSKTETTPSTDDSPNHHSLNQNALNKNIAHSANKETLGNLKSQVTTVISDAGSEKDKNKIIRQCHEALRNLSSWSINQSLDTPSAYAMNRFSTWMGVSQVPIHTDLVTPLKPVPKDKLNHYHNLFSSHNYQELIPLVEQSFSKSPFWLDAHRLVSVSLEALGMDESAIQVKEQLAVFLRRFPDLVKLKFSDHSDFADQLTRQWINTEVLSASSSENFSLSSSDDKDSDFEVFIEQARELVKQQKLKEAIALLQNQVTQQANLRKQTYWKYHLAQFCFENGKYEISFFLLKEIDGFLIKNKLTYWESKLEKNVVYLLILSLKNSTTLFFDVPTEDQSDTDENKNSLNEKTEFHQLYSRLCHLDPTLALEL